MIVNYNDLKGIFNLNNLLSPGMKIRPQDLQSIAAAFFSSPVLVWSKLMHSCEFSNLGNTSAPA